ncbi:unnamed protein product [Bursaphelenchus xylophilus]|uniref:(pine wood nematode) hypothetical protein n=1 Tax=Bursaphelenchus xylophilus TaxID=6326 RepID=A0A1I7RL43_BURXY|nr:unnamed protein product [Bursaphelenchus xylophilus]CAG9083482.1 unnamed protein product [Bursaphelenchus xylophilus]
MKTARHLISEGAKLPPPLGPERRGMELKKTCQHDANNGERRMMPLSTDGAHRRGERKRTRRTALSFGRGV